MQTEINYAVAEQRIESDGAELADLLDFMGVAWVITQLCRLRDFLTTPAVVHTAGICACIGVGALLVVLGVLR